MKNNINLDSAIKIFAQFLNKTWDTIMPLLVGRDYTSDESAISDWIQANWEILIERKVLDNSQFLEVYCEGADFNGQSSRITDIDASPNFNVSVCSVKSTKIFDLLNEEYFILDNTEFIELVTFEKGFYWDTIMPLLVGRDYTSDESAISDWIQANWEILIERKVLDNSQFLEVYCEGADFNGQSSRITDIDASPNFNVSVCSVKSTKIFDLLNEEYFILDNTEFIELVTFEKGFYCKKPNFNCVLVSDKEGLERVFSIDSEIKFVLNLIK